MTEDEITLVHQSQRGDREAFARLVRNTSRLIYSRLLLDTGDAHRAEDLTQEVYLSAWSKLNQLGEASKFRSWLISIATRVSLDAGKFSTRKKRVDPKGKEVEPVSDAGDPATVIGKTEERERALAALKSLPEMYREPLMLRYLTGADYDTISRQLAISNGSLRGLLQRGMEMLREQMTRSSSSRG